MLSSVMMVADHNSELTVPIQTERKQKCPDCLECQICGKSRCQLCKRGGHKDCVSELGPFITHGEYLEWKRQNMKCGNSLAL